MQGRDAASEAAWVVLPSSVRRCVGKGRINDVGWPPGYSSTRSAEMNSPPRFDPAPAAGCSVARSRRRNVRAGYVPMPPLSCGDFHCRTDGSAGFLSL